jgi:hypothetical protein
MYHPSIKINQRKAVSLKVEIGSEMRLDRIYLQENQTSEMVLAFVPQQLTIGSER